MVKHVSKTKSYTNFIQCICGYQGLSVEARQHRECPKCHTVVEACCEGNNCF
jgi:hypothetical protein